MCEGIHAPVWYKLQSPSPPLENTDLDLQEGETPFLRSARIMRHLRAANDSRLPGIYVCICIYIYISRTSGHVCIYIDIHTSVYMCIYICVYIDIYICNEASQSSN
jgi:hypothetical protein